MAAIDEWISDASKRMDKSVESARNELNTVRTGRASAALLDRVNVDYYGQPTPLRQLATINVPEPRMLTIQPFDPNSVKEIERALMESDLGLTPSNDGKIIRLPIPQLTEERRKELVKVVRHIAEEGTRRVRNIRRDAIHHLKELSNNGEVGVGRGTSRGGAGAEADRRAHEVDRRAAAAQRARDHGGLSSVPPNGAGTVHQRASVAEPAAGPDVPDIPRSIAIIMDGNGRWARDPRPAGRRGPPGRHACAPSQRRGVHRPRRRVPDRLRVLDRELDTADG